MVSVRGWHYGHKQIAYDVYDIHTWKYLLNMDTYDYVDFYWNGNLAPYPSKQYGYWYDYY